LRVCARYRCVTIENTNTSPDASVRQNEKGIFIVLLFSSRIIFIYGGILNGPVKIMKETEDYTES